MKNVTIFFEILALFLARSYAQYEWYYQNPVPIPSTLTSIQFLDADTGWTTGASGTILHSTDGGESSEFQLIDSLHSMKER